MPHLHPAPSSAGRAPAAAAKGFGAVAQLGERRNGIAKVRGSIPLGSTILSRLPGSCRFPSGVGASVVPDGPPRKRDKSPGKPILLYRSALETRAKRASAEETMTQFLFHLDDGTDEPPDEVVELADLDEARTVALRFLGQYLQDHCNDFWVRGDCRLVVSDEAGLTLLAVHVLATEAPAAQVAVVPNPAA